MLPGLIGHDVPSQLLPAAIPATSCARLRGIRYRSIVTNDGPVSGIATTDRAGLASVDCQDRLITSVGQHHGSNPLARCRAAGRLPGLRGQNPQAQRP